MTSIQAVTRRAGVLAILVVLAGCAPRSSTQTRAATRPPEALEEATRLQEEVKTLYRERKFREAVPLAERSLELHQRALGSHHPDIAIQLVNLATLYEAQGAYAQAESTLVRALEIHEQARGARHPDVASSLNNLATLYFERGAYAKAEPRTEQLLVRAHYQAQGAYARAEPHYVRAIDITERTLGATHPEVATCLHNLALLYREQGMDARAEPLMVRALEIEEKARGATHPMVASRLSSLADLYQARGAYARAEPLLARAAELREPYLEIELARLSESRKRDLMSLPQAEMMALASFHAHAMPASPRALELAFTTILRRKGRVLDSLADTQVSLRAHLTPQLRDKISQLADAGTQLSTRLRAPFDPRTAQHQDAEIASLRTRIEALEGELNAASVEFRAQSEPVTIAKIQAALPRGAALVELVRYRRLDDRQVRRSWQEARYLAYLLPWRGPPQWVALGEAARIEAGVDAVLAAMRKDASANAAKAALRNLDALIFAPIRGRLPGTSHFILSPDGKLNLVPFEALIDSQGRHALEQQLISYVTSGRDLLRLAARRAPQSSATIVADPDYGPGKRFGRLPGTLAEAREIQQRVPGIKALTQGQATKAALSALAGPSVLHVATHGFYSRGGSASAPTSPSPPVQPRRPSARDRGMSIESAIAPLPPPPAEDPAEALDHAGLALAGANVRPDGVISARELAGLDWWGTQLVVLSACETGVGAVPSGEGVYGLRRALVLAGAQAQVVSLWNVNDSSAPELMREFYAELARGTGRAEALRRAKRRMLEQPRFAHPYYWAAFIAAGDWAPLDKDPMRRPEPGR